MAKAGLITTDIETYHTLNPVVVARIEKEARSKQPAQNVKVDLKNAWKTSSAMDKRAREAVDKTAVDVMLAEPLCCVYRVNGQAYRYSMMPLDLKVSYEVLEELSARFDEVAGPETIWVGHNILGFDFAVLLNQWRRFDILPPEHFPKYQRKRWYGRVYDTMEHMPCPNGLGFVSLDDCFEALGMGRAKSVKWVKANGTELLMSGSVVGLAYDEGAYDVILNYCEADVEAEEQLYLRMTCGGEWGTWGVIDEVAEKIREIDGGDEPETAKILAKFRVMEMSGLVPG